MTLLSSSPHESSSIALSRRRLYLVESMSGNRPILPLLIAALFIAGCSAILEVPHEENPYDRANTIEGFPESSEVVCWISELVEIRVERSTIENVLRGEDSTNRNAAAILSFLEDHIGPELEILESDRSIWFSTSDYIFELLEAGRAMVVDRRSNAVVDHVLFNCDYRVGEHDMVAWKLFYFSDGTQFWRTLYLIS